jgi:exodeoxyribonuclease VII large subunit
VQARGRLSVYEPRGEYELIVDALDPVGEGALRVAFEQMRIRLAAEGLFDQKLKQPLPLFPRRIGIVTSQSGAAIRDILTVLARRTRTIHVLFSPARVQGEGAALEIARALKLLNEFHARALRDGRMDQTIDVVIVGSIRASKIPVISAVGHETDVSISDFAADVRAATPSAAAELVAAREDQIGAYVKTLSRDLVRITRSRATGARLRVQKAALSPAFEEVRARLHDAKSNVDAAAPKLETFMMRRGQQARRRIDTLMSRLSPARLGGRVSAAQARFVALRGAHDAAIAARIEDARGRLARAAASLDALSPLAVLKRGYALAQDERGKLLRDSREVQVGDAVRLRLSEGLLRCRVEETENN